MPEERKKILEVKHLKQYFKNGRNVTKGVDDVSFDIYEGEVFGLVGESGSGKTTTGRAILQLYKPTAGEVLFEGKDVTKLHGREENLAFRRDAQMIFQDPYASLKPRMTVEDIIAEGLDIHHLVKSKEERRKRVEDLLETVGLNRNHASRFPHEFSGGQRQRIGIARARAEHDGSRLHRLELVDRGRVVLHDLHVRTQHPQFLDDVVGERIVVVYHQNHKNSFTAWLRTSRRRRWPWTC